LQTLVLPNAPAHGKRSREAHPDQKASVPGSGAAEKAMIVATAAPSMQSVQLMNHP
jgi:hypothetical protein